MIVTLLKFVHIAAIAVWAAGLICLPYLNRQRNRVGEATDLHRLHSMVRFFYVVIVSPAAFIAIGSGTALIFEQQTFNLWFSLKLLLVGALVGIHMRLGHVILRLFEKSARWPPWRHAAFATITLVIATAIVTLVLTKPSMNSRTLDTDLFEPGGLRAMFDRIAHQSAREDEVVLASTFRIDHQADAVMKNQFAAVPAREASEDRGQQRQPESVRQDFIGRREPQPPIGAGDREQRHRRNGVRPAADSAANAFDCKQFRGSDQRCEDAEPEGESRAPHAGAQKKIVAEKPVEDVDSQRGEY